MSDTMIGTSAAIIGIRSEVECAARSDAKVLLMGESGVGKDIAARMIHQQSARSQRPFVTINCVSIPDTLLEAELFGHVRGSFTGAYRDRIGLLEAAHGGTVFLDEVCETSPRMQALLLRFLESGEIQRVGSDRTQCRVDARVLAASNRNPLELVAAKIFREDLYYRLNVIEIQIPPLRARREDIPVLFEHFLRRCADASGVPTPAIAPDARTALMEFEWPGNIRQLKNVAERVIARGTGGTHPPFITITDLPPEVTGDRRVAHLVSAQPARVPIQAIFDRMVHGRESFWSAVYPAFMIRDLTRADLRLIIGRGLEETAGSYKMLVELLNMEPTDYKRFLNFLQRHECQVPFERYRCARRQATPQDGFSTANFADEIIPALDDLIPYLTT